MIRQYLAADHARLDAALQRGGYQEFREGLLRHIAIEQKILFPIVTGSPLVLVLIGWGVWHARRTFSAL